MSVAVVPPFLPNYVSDGFGGFNPYGLRRQVTEQPSLRKCMAACAGYERETCNLAASTQKRLKNIAARGIQLPLAPCMGAIAVAGRIGWTQITTWRCRIVYLYSRPGNMLLAQFPSCHPGAGGGQFSAHGQRAVGDARLCGSGAAPRRRAPRVPSERADAHHRSRTPLEGGG